MKDWKSIAISPQTKILDTMKLLEKQATQFVIVADAQGVAQGTITDGDIRRGILKGISLDQSVSEIMNRKFSYAHPDESRQQMMAKLTSKKINYLPIVDHHMRLIEIKHFSDLEQKGAKDNPVVILAGGLGSRLGELTQDCPKPLLKVGDAPILENIIQNFSTHGFSNINLSVNYKSEMIEEYFQNGERWGVQINYLKEDKKLGTAGPLAKLKTSNSDGKPVIVMNGDLLTKVNFSKLLEYHEKHKADATICVRQYDVQIPYGVIDFAGGQFHGFEEKPTKVFFVNAGIYAFNPDLFGHIPDNEYFDMNSFIDLLHREGKKINIFPLHEYWIDIGRIDDLNRARSEALEPK